MAERVARSTGSRADGGRRDSGEGRRGARGRAAAAAAARRGGALTTATVGGSTGEGLASLQHDEAMADAAPAGGRTVGSSGGPAARTAARGAATCHRGDQRKGDRERATAAAARRPELRRGWLDGGAAPAAALEWRGATTTLFAERKTKRDPLLDMKAQKGNLS
ncbi:hypothetical protein Scep_006284 [Stephania cephalantha]|uniref:Uncharacterized protein n=1 Tax=Stephania cephalantha TaxID=152367 RepID=A0AAP0KA79_9MAGN